MTTESPQSFVVREESEKAASQNGFRRVLGEEAGWRAFGSTTAQGIIHLAAEGVLGPWFLAVDHAGVIAELGLPTATMPGPGKTRYAFPMRIPTKAPVYNGIMPPGDSGIMAPPSNGMIPPGRRGR